MTNLTHQEKIARLMEEISRKDLSRGCYYMGCFLSEDDTFEKRYLKKLYFYDEYNKSYAPNDFDIMVDDNDKEVGECPYNDYEKNGYTLAMETEDGGYWYVNKILGHPVYLHDLLIYIVGRNDKMFYYKVEQNEENPLENLIYIDIYEDGDEILDCCVPRELSKPLDNQSEETINKLYLIIFLEGNNH